MRTILQILKQKEIQEIWSIAPDTTVYEGIKTLAEKRIGALLVMENERLCGIFSERDYARGVILKGRASKETPVSDIMTDQVVTISPISGVEESLSVMTDNRIRHLPVVDNGKVIGMISIGDLVLDIISNQKATIAELENYIRG